MITTPGYPGRVEGRKAVAESDRPYGTMIGLKDDVDDLAVHHDIKTGVAGARVRLRRPSRSDRGPGHQPGHPRSSRSPLARSLAGDDLPLPRASSTPWTAVTSTDGASVLDWRQEAHEGRRRNRSISDRVRVRGVSSTRGRCWRQPTLRESFAITTSRGRRRPCAGRSRRPGPPSARRAIAWPPPKDRRSRAGRSTSCPRRGGLAERAAPSTGERPGVSIATQRTGLVAEARPVEGFLDVQAAVDQVATNCR